MFFYVIIWPCDCISMRCKNCKAVNNVKQGCILKDCLPNSQVSTKVTSLWGQYDRWTFSMFPTLRQCIMGSLAHQQVYCMVQRPFFSQLQRHENLGLLQWPVHVPDYCITVWHCFTFNFTDHREVPGFPICLWQFHCSTTMFTLQRRN